MAYYLTFDAVDRNSGKIIQKYLYNIACTSQEEIDEFKTRGSDIIYFDLRHIPDVKVCHKLENYRELGKTLKSYKFIDPERNSAPYTPILHLPKGKKFLLEI